MVAFWLVNCLYILAGHCLLWKGIGWMTYSKPKGISDDDLRQLYLTRIEDYIRTMLTRYKGVVLRVR